MTRQLSIQEAIGNGIRTGDQKSEDFQALDASRLGEGCKDEPSIGRRMGGREGPAGYVERGGPGKRPQPPTRHAVKSGTRKPYTRPAGCLEALRGLLKGIRAAHAETDEPDEALEIASDLQDARADSEKARRFITAIQQIQAEAGSLLNTISF